MAYPIAFSAFRTIALIFALGFIVCGASAQPVETVEVEDSSPTGVWKFVMPQGFKSSLVGKTEWGPTIDVFCEIEKIRTELMVHCPGLHGGGGDISRGTVSINGNRIRLVWGSMLNHISIIPRPFRFGFQRFRSIL